VILTVLCRPDIDKALAAKVAIWLWKQGLTESEFYVFGDHADADR
jgi:hypothetical protein